MKKYNKNIIFLTFIALSAIALSTSVNSKEVGFQAVFEYRPMAVSNYFEPPDKLAVGLSSKSFPIFSFHLKRVPKLTSTSFKNHSIRFETTIFNRGKIKQKLIPISVDATSYLNYRIDKYKREKFNSAFISSFTNPQGKKRRRGLGLTVPLPKRLDKIFGEGGAGLRVTGFRRITFSGRSQWQDVSNSDNFRQSRFPSLNMEQISKFDINGTIGSKITVKVAQDSKTDIPLENSIQIRYKGDEDDILKTIEAGNTNLSLSNTRFVGYSQRIQGLFGLKVQAQVGNIRFTGIASQEKGSAERTSISALGEASAKIIREYSFARNRIFDLAYKDEELGYLDEFQPGDTVVRLHIYDLIRTGGFDNEEVASSLNAHLYVDPNDTTKFPEESQKIRVKQLEPTMFEWGEVDKNTGIPYVVFKRSQQENKTLAFYMEIKKQGTGEIVKVGDITQTLPGDSVYLKLLYPNSTNSRTSNKTWQLMWRNVYNMPRGISLEDVEIKIFKGLSGTEATSSENLDVQQGTSSSPKYIQVLGLDQYNTANNKNPDGRVDERSEVFRSDWGLLIFPEREPFNSDVSFSGFVPLADKVPEIYNTKSTGLSFVSSSKYYIQITTQSRGSIISLKRVNIIEGSERVMLNGRQLTKGKDYNISYEIGQVTLLNEEALDPNADLSIDFEYAPFLSLQKKTLVGARMEYEWSENLKFGTTYLHKSDKAQNRKPKVGQETATMTVLDFDASWKLEPTFLTKAMNALPFVTTDAKSRLNISGELAQSRPNPNVDNVAYVDDFESALDQVSLGNSRTNWHIASQPVPVEDAENVLGEEYERGNILWHNPDLSNEIVNVDDVYDRESRQGEGLLRSFRMIYEPNNQKIVQNLDSTADTTFVKSWAGITTYFATRVDAKRVRLFEFRAKIDDSVKAKLHFDFGSISEDLDIYESHIDNAFDEDGSGEFSTPNGNAEPDEDIGLDGIRNELEEGYDIDTLPDPSGDNWYFEGDGLCPLPPDSCAMLSDENHPLWRTPSFRYRWLNGTEGNIDDPPVQGNADREKLPLDGTFNEINAYFSFEIDLDKTVLENGPILVPNSERNGWQTYRIPIRDTAAYDFDVSYSDGAVQPDWDEITHVRVWIETDETQTEPITIEIANWYFVQSNWQDTVKNYPISSKSSKVTVASVSTEDGTFVAPPGVEAYTDPTYNITEPQRGLQFSFDSLNFRDTLIATKELVNVDSYSGYKKMLMYVNVNQLQTNGGDVEFFFRIGRDEKNYYEHLAILQSGIQWDTANWVEIDFEKLTALKDSVIRSGVNPNEINVTSGKYHITGNPNLNQIRYFAVGVRNKEDSLLNSESYSSGEIWLDELRVTDARRDIGTAKRITFSGNMADVIDYNLSYQTKDPFFRGISTATRGGSNNNLGSGKTETSFNYGFTFKLHKFLPIEWGARIPIRYTFTKRTLIPLLRNGTDILLPEDVREQEKNESESISIGINGITFNHRGNNLLFKHFLNKLTSTSISYGQTKQRSVTTPFNYGENFSFRSGIKLGMQKPPSLALFSWAKSLPILKKTSESKLYFYPTNFTLSGDFSRKLTITDDLSGQRRSNISRNFSGGVDLNFKVLDNLTTGFRYKTTRDLSDLEHKGGIETRYVHNFSGSYDPKVFSFFTTAFTYHADYNEAYDKSFESSRSVLGRGWGISGKFDHKKLLTGGSSSSSRRRFKGDSRNKRQQKLKDNKNEKDKKDKKKSGPGILDKPTKFLRKLTGWINPFNYKYSKNFNNSLPAIIERPGWRYQFGLDLDPGNIAFGESTRKPTSNQSESYSLSSGFIMFGGIKTDVSIRRSISEDLVTQGDRFKGVTTGWPELTIRIQKFRSLPFIKSYVNKFIDIFSPRTGYSRQERTRFNLVGNFFTDRTISVSHNPLLSINLKLWRSLSLSGSYVLTKDNRDDFNSLTGAFQTETRSIRKTIAVTTKYSFSSPNGISIPLLGRLKFRSTMTFELNVKKNSDFSESANKGAEFVTNTEKSDISIAPRISYQFSKQIKGGINARWQDSNDVKSRRNNHVRELQIWTEIRF